MTLVKDLLNEGITDSCACVSLCYFRQQINHIAKYTDTGKMENIKRNIVSRYKNTTINKESTLSSRAMSLIHISVVAFFYCVLKHRITMKELNMSLLKQNMLGRVVLGFPKPLECTNSFPIQVLTSLVFNGRSPMWCSIPNRSSQGLLDAELC